MLQGLVVGTYGRHCDVQTADGKIIPCTTRGRKTGIACGDQAEITPAKNNQGVIEKILPRFSLLYRSDPFREKLFAANVTQVVIVLASVPSYNEDILNAGLVAAEAATISSLIVLNKADLLEETRRAMEALAIYEKLGCELLVISALKDISPLRAHLTGHTSVLLGESGMGKSTLLNALLPDAKARTGEISTALDSGKHTTTATQMYHIDADSKIIDSPGFQEFGLFHLSDTDITYSMPEFRPLLGQCRFSNCRHLQEPGCAITSSDKVSKRRLAFYQNLIAKHDALRAMNPAVGTKNSGRK
ncbi:MAG: ribosome small subunit-dependent GTPase A [Burkholderiales bacterium]